MRLLLPGFFIEQNDRAFGSLDRVSGFRFLPLNALMKGHNACLIRRPDCLIGRPDLRREPVPDRTDRHALRRNGSYANEIERR